MDQLFKGNKPKLPGVQYSGYSTEITEQRYKAGFFTKVLLSTYTKLHFLASKFDFDVVVLLELLLENIYIDEKFEVYVAQIEKFETENKMLDFEWSLLGPVFEHYMKNKGLPNERRSDILKDLQFLLTIDLIMRPRDSNWKLTILFVRSLREIRFHSKAFCERKIEKLVENTEHFFDIKNPVYRGFVKHMKKTHFLNDPLTNQKIENLLTRYFLHYSKHLLKFGRS